MVIDLMNIKHHVQTQILSFTNLISLFIIRCLGKTHSYQVHNFQMFYIVFHYIYFVYFRVLSVPSSKSRHHKYQIISALFIDFLHKKIRILLIMQDWHVLFIGLFHMFSQVKLPYQALGSNKNYKHIETLTKCL